MESARQNVRQLSPLSAGMEGTPFISHLSVLERWKSANRDGLKINKYIYISNKWADCWMGKSLNCGIIFVLF